MFNQFFDFFIDFSKNIFTLVQWLFFDEIVIEINGTSYTILPVGLLIGVVALSFAILRRITGGIGGIL